MKTISILMTMLNQVDGAGGQDDDDHGLPRSLCRLCRAFDHWSHQHSCQWQPAF